MLDNNIQHYWKLIEGRLYYIATWLGGRIHLAERGKMFIKKRGVGRPQSASDDAHVNADRTLPEEHSCWTCTKLARELELLLVRFFPHLRRN